MPRRKLQKRSAQNRIKEGKILTSNSTEGKLPVGDYFSSLFRQATDLSLEVRNVKVVQISSISLREKFKELVKKYFRILRPELVVQKVSTEELDGLMQRLMLISNSYTSKTAYRRTLMDICSQFADIEIKREYSVSNVLASTQAQTATIIKITNENESIITTLKSAVPAAAISYKQVLDDLQKPRISYRGTVAELREILREVLDYLAPDKDVELAPNFKLEEGTKKPTMKQKVRFILKNRNKSATAIEVPEEATVVVDEGIAKLVRATYNRGSLLTHTHVEGQSETLQIKRYLDTLLRELLEIK